MALELLGFIPSRHFLTGYVVLDTGGGFVTLPAVTPQEVKMSRGDTLELRVQILAASTEAPVNLTNAVVNFTLKRVDPFSKPVGVNPALLTLSSEDEASQITLDAPTTGVIDIDLVPANTQFLTPGFHRFDVEITLTDGRVFTPLVKDLYISEDITRPV